MSAGLDPRNGQRSMLNAERSNCPGVYDPEERLPDYSVRIIRVTGSIKRTPAGVHIADQLLRSGTSPYGNHGEADEFVRIFAKSIQTASANEGFRK